MRVEAIGVPFRLRDEVAARNEVATELLSRGGRYRARAAIGLEAVCLVDGRVVNIPCVDSGKCV